jgi:hypothetical protein
MELGVFTRSRSRRRTHGRGSFVASWTALDDDPLLLCGCDDEHHTCDDEAAVASLQPW